MDSPNGWPKAHRSTAAERMSFKARAINFGLLIAGYGVGQGSIFLAQTWLLTQGRLELLALFGTHFAFALFGILVVDAGALTILARHAASMEHEPEEASGLWRTFWETSIFRAVLATIVIAAGAVGVAIADEPFTQGYALYAAPAFLLWALNAAGLLDGFKLSGVSGLSGSLAYASSGIALVFAQGLEPYGAGALLGAAFSLGYLLTVAAQFLALRAIGRGAQFERPHLGGVYSAVRDGLMVLGGTLPGQAYFRLQLIMSSIWLGGASTALFVYVKQIVTAVTQLIGFIRRVEFPKLVQVLAQRDVDPLATTWRLQLAGTLAGGGATLCLVSLGLVLSVIDNPFPPNLGLCLAAFALSIAFSAVFLAFSQGLAALGWYGAICIRALAAAATGILLSLVLARPLGIYGFAIADLAAAGTSCVIAALALRQPRRIRSVTPSKLG